MTGIGIDMVSISRVSIKVADKILSEKELIEFKGYLKGHRQRAMEFLAGRLASKEAYLKAIGVSLLDGIALSDIVIYKDEFNVPHFKDAPNARLTLTHEQGLAVAVVVVE